MMRYRYDCLAYFHWISRVFPAAACVAVLAALSIAPWVHAAEKSTSGLRAGAAIVDVTPTRFPVAINGGMTAGTAQQANTQIHARALVLEDGGEKLAIVVVDSCMMSRAFLDEAKQLATQRTGIAANRMLISATHAHSVPAAMGCLGTDADENYVPYLRLKIADAIETAMKNLEPAKVGWAVTNAAHYTAVRQWVRRPDRLAADPFGNLTVRANMHAGRVWDDVTGEAGPEDPDLAILSVQSMAGRPLAVLANFSMHYFSGEQPVSADYFGLFCRGLQSRLGASDQQNSVAPFVGILSHGCSGDIWRMDYTKQTPTRFESIKIDQYANELVELALAAMKSIAYDEHADLSMAETRLHLKYRVPDKQRLEWAQAIVAKMGPRLPKTSEEIYAREQIMLHEKQETDVVVQAIRIGELAIATTPTETYAITGLKIKRQSPLARTMVIELAGGGDGYIPPPEHHPLGGYNTWAARSAGLEIEAEPKIAEAAIGLLEQVSKKPRRPLELVDGPTAREIIASEPAAYYRLNEAQAPRVRDHSSAHLDAIYEPGILFFLEGPASKEYCQVEINRAIHTAGGRVRTAIPGLGDQYSITLWIWNGMPLDARPIAGWFFGRGHNYNARLGDALGIVGQGEQAGRLVFQMGDSPQVIGKTAIARWAWAKVRLERRGERVQVFLEQVHPQQLADTTPTPKESARFDASVPEIDCVAPMDLPLEVSSLFFGGRADSQSNWEGRIDEIVIRRLK